MSLDIGARGLDYHAVDLVVNVAPPVTVADYVHRAGRTARNGRSGVVVTLTQGVEQSKLLARYCGRTEG